MEEADMFLTCHIPENMKGEGGLLCYGTRSSVHTCCTLLLAPHLSCCSLTPCFGTVSGIQYSSCFLIPNT